jgi:hypothetical protein
MGSGLEDRPNKKKKLVTEASDPAQIFATFGQFTESSIRKQVHVIGGKCLVA